MANDKCIENINLHDKCFLCNGLSDICGWRKYRTRDTHSGFVLGNMPFGKYRLDYMGCKMKYLIHAMPKRMWYVNNYLIPSMIAQGICKADISIYCDNNGDGNLKSFVKSLEKFSKNKKGGIWHMQDDVLISSKFKIKTEKEYKDIVCGFCSAYDRSEKGSWVSMVEKWLSFPCIFIPNEIATEFIEWIYDKNGKSAAVIEKIEHGADDDSIFNDFLLEKHPNGKALNLKPNIIEHVDWLIGGSVLNHKRKTNPRSRFFEDIHLVDELEASIHENSHTEQR